MVVGGVSLRNRCFLAPMSGVSDLPFRRIAARYGAGLVVSEMVASDALVGGDGETVLRSVGEGIFPHVVQLAGREARWMAEGARMAEAAGADIIDINMGCPAKRVTTGYSGSALMRDLDHAMTLVEATVSAASVPVTLKMRLGWDEKTINAAELARRAEDAGIALVTVHGRTRCQFYKGQADWDAIRAVRDAVSIPLVANGDCGSADDAREMMRRSGADAVMVGRASYGRPWLAGQIGAELNGEDVPEQPRGVALADLVTGHYEALLEHYGVHIGLRAARKHLGWYLDAAGIECPGANRRILMTAEDPAVVLRLVEEIFRDGDVRSAA
nr:tRNA dihydrouridine synthase DusB [Breoghania corrubedonensis]